ncbi:MAG: metallophosphoesterase [Proteobacteria bacterium]|nr:metallophosphoesterase [Pseudomonadota bacterium]
MTEASHAVEAAAQCIRLLVLSDLHVDPDPTSDESHLSMTPSPTSPNGDPFVTALELIKTEAIAADYVLCPGDLGNRAHPGALADAWKRLAELKQAVGAQQLIAATGNHDLDSRLKHNSYDPTEILKGLAPRYPVSSESESNRYWAHHFAVVEATNLRVVSLNSSAYHWIENEWERGRVSIATLEEIKRYLSGASPKLVNVLLCHHHPHRHPELRIPNSSFDVMMDGNHLVHLLGSGDFGSWMIVHGHKHHPNLIYASGAANPPVVLSCGSFSARIYKELSTLARNQMYLIEYPLNDIRDLGLVGRVRAWDWAYGRGWAIAANGQLPAVSPFGAREAPTVYANRIFRLVSEGSYSRWDELVRLEPMLDYLPPEKAQKVFSLLMSQYKMTVEFDGQLPRQVSKP